MKYARFIDNTAVEIFTPPNGFGISDCFHPTVANQFEAVADDVESGWKKPVDVNLSQQIDSDPLIEEKPMSWNVDLKITNNTKYNIDVVNNDSGQTGEIVPGGTFDWGTADPNNTNSLRFWDATVSPKTYYMQGGISFGPEAGVYVDRGWMAADDQSISATFCANGNCWTQTQNGGETLLAWNQFEGGGQITAVFNS